MSLLKTANMSMGRHQFWSEIVMKTYLTSLGKNISSRRLALFYVFNEGCNSEKNYSRRHFLKIVQVIHKIGVVVFLKKYLTSSMKTYIMNQPSDSSVCRGAHALSLSPSIAPSYPASARSRLMLGARAWMISPRVNFPKDG